MHPSKTQGNFCVKKEVCTLCRHDGSELHIYVNGKEFTKSSKHNNGYWHSDSVLIAIELNTNDTLWVQMGVTPTQIRGDFHSRFTVIKIH